MKHWSRAFAYFRPELPAVLAAIGLMLLGIVASVLKPWPLAIIIDNILGDKPLPAWLPGWFANTDKGVAIGFCAVLIFLLHAIQGSFSAGQNYISIKVGLRGLSRIREQLFDWMQRLSLAFYQRRSQGDLIYRATWDTYSLQTIFQQGIFKFLSSFVTVILMLVVMWQVNRALTLVTAGIFPPLVLAMYFFGRKMNQRSLAALQADSKVSSLVQRNISALPVVQSYVREEQESREFKKEVESSFRQRRRQHGIEVVYWLVIAALFGIGTAILSWWGGREILQQRLTIGELVIFLSYLGQLYDPLNQLSHVGATVAEANAGLTRIFEILDSKEELPQAVDALPLVKKRGGLNVKFDHVTFGYIPSKPVLRGVTFEVKAGEIIGVVGPSGAGKTTLLNLISRFYDVQEGSLLIEGIDCRKDRLKDLRENIAYVFQESFLLPGTLAQNIAYGCPEATLERIEGAAKLANAEEFIKALPQGYETLVGEEGARLSVGEKQRISLARAFLKDAPILLLDEPTSSLDAETEAKVVESIERLMGGRTTFLVAHRVSTLQKVEKILVVEGVGGIQMGTPDDLLQIESYYRRMSN